MNIVDECVVALLSPVDCGKPQPSWSGVSGLLTFLSHFFVSVWGGGNMFQLNLKLFNVTLT